MGALSPFDIANGSTRPSAPAGAAGASRARAPREQAAPTSRQSTHWWYSFDTWHRRVVEEEFVLA